MAVAAVVVLILFLLGFIIVTLDFEIEIYKSTEEYQQAKLKYDWLNS